MRHRYRMFLVVLAPWPFFIPIALFETAFLGDYTRRLILNFSEAAMFSFGGMLGYFIALLPKPKKVVKT